MRGVQQLPDHLNTTARKFKQRKRAQVKRLEHAVRAIRYASAYVPPAAYQRICRIDDEIDTLRIELSLAVWGR